MQSRWLMPFFLFSCIQADAQAKRQPPPSDFFRDPQLLCAALEENGVHTGLWRQIGAGFAVPQARYSFPSPYTCEYPPWTHAPPIQASLPRPETPGISLIYRVSGDAEELADIITIAVTVHRPESMRAGEEELKRQIQLLFKSIKRPLPSGLIAAIGNHAYFRSRQSYGFVSFDLLTPERMLNREKGQQVLRLRVWK